jgi:hypothetical protein
MPLQYLYQDEFNHINNNKLYLLNPAKFSLLKTIIVLCVT